MKLDAHAMSVCVAEDWFRSFLKPLDWQSYTYLRTCIFSRATSSHGRWVKSDLNGFQRKCERKKRRSESRRAWLFFSVPLNICCVCCDLELCYVADWTLQFGCLLLRLSQQGPISLVTPEDQFSVLSQRKTTSFLHSHRLRHLHFYSFVASELFLYCNRNASSLLLFQFHSCLGVSILTSSSILIHFSAARGGSKAQPICPDIKRCLDVRDMWAREKETDRGRGMV